MKWAKLKQNESRLLQSVTAKCPFVVFCAVKTQQNLGIFNISSPEVVLQVKDDTAADMFNDSP